MFDRIWSTIKRHKKKLGVLIFGGYIAYKILIPKIQMYLVSRFLGSFGDPEALAGPMRQLLDIVRGEDGVKKQERFRHSQQVSDKYVRRNLEEVRVAHHDLYAIQDTTAALKSKVMTKAEKMEIFKNLQVECISRMISAIYLLHMLLLLHRVEFNIVGREMMDSAPQDGEQEHTFLMSLLVSTRYVQEEGLKPLSACVREAVKSCCSSSQIEPTTRVSPIMFGSFLQDVCKKVDKSLLTGRASVTTLLPECIDKHITDEKDRVMCLLNEARDYVESPQFLEVFQVVSGNAIKEVTSQIFETGKEAGGAEGKSILANLFGTMTNLSNTVLNADAVFIDRFAEEPIVTELCESVFFQPNEVQQGSDFS